MTENLADVLRRMPQHLQEPGERLHWLWLQAESHTELCHEDLALAVFNEHHDCGRQLRAIVLPKDKRECWKKLGRYLDPNTAVNLPLDIALSVIEALPEPYSSAARVAIFKAGAQPDSEEVCIHQARDEAQAVDGVCDMHRYSLNNQAYLASCTADELRGIALNLRVGGNKRIQLANACDREAAKKDAVGRGRTA